MVRLTFLVFLTAPALVHALRDDESGKRADGHVSVSPKANGAFAQLHEDRLESVSQHKDSQASALETGSETGMREVAEASSGMSKLHEQSMSVRKAVQELGLESGLDESALKAETAEKAKAKAKLQELSLERHRVKQMSDELDSQMQKQYAALQAPEEAASLLSVAETTDDASKPSVAEDEEFAELEKQTDNLLRWREELKQIREARDKMMSDKEDAIKAAQSVGLSEEEVQHELDGPPPASSFAATAIEPTKAASNADQRKQLADVMASSAVEMAQIESAASDVMKGLDDFSKWKQRQDESPESLAEAAKVKAKLDKAMKYLQEHEGVVNKRTDQINDLMKQAGLEPL